MARQAAGEASLDQLPWAYRKGHGKPIGWKAGARCKAERATVTAPKGGTVSIWLVEDFETYQVGDATISGDQLIGVALTLCALCSAQWDCASFAVAVDEDFGVWGMSLADLLWLRKRGNATEIIERARYEGQPVQYAVRDARRLT